MIRHKIVTGHSKGRARCQQEVDGEACGVHRGRGEWQEGSKVTGWNWGGKDPEKTCEFCSRTGHGASLPKRHVRRKNTFANIASLLGRGRLPIWSRQQTLTRRRRLKLCQPHSVAEGCGKFG